MKTHLKKIIILSLGLLVIITFGIVLRKQTKNGDQESGIEQKTGEVESNKNIKKRRTNFARSREEHTTIREAAINTFYDFPDDFPKAVIEGRTFVLVGYDEGHDPNTGSVTRGGVLIFEKTSEGKFNLFWESKEYIVHGEGSYSRFQDLTNDDIPEIVVEDSPGATGRTTTFLVYAWQDGTFKLVTPSQRSRVPNSTLFYTKIGGDNAETYIKDIDNDKVMEIIGGYISDTDHMLHQEIYKWNGKEYYLWKKVVEKKVYQ